MTYDESLVKGIEALGLRIAPNVDTSSGEEYVVYTYDRSGALWGDDAPCLEHRRWTVVYVAPLEENRETVRESIIALIQDIFGCYPKEDGETDQNGQIYLYTFESIGGIDDG